MPRLPRLTEQRLRRLREAAQLLHRPPGKRDPADVVRHLVGVQAQVPGAAAQGLRVRTRGLTAAAVDRARFEDRTIVWTWAMRGTLHFVAGEDLEWLHPLTVEASIPRSHRRLEQEGVPARRHDRAVAEIRRILERDAPLTRPQLAERLRAKRIRTGGQSIAHLVWLAAAEGVCCYGPEVDGEPAFVLLDEWVGPRRPLDRDAALNELAVRYLRSHGPATVADLAAWSGVKASDAKRAWRAVEDRLKEMHLGLTGLWLLKSQKGEARPGLVRLLPAFDEYVLGWKDRGFVVPPQLWKKVNAGGGWLHPVILSDGRAVGTWATERSRDGLLVRTDPFSLLDAAVKKGVREEEKDLRRFLGSRAQARSE